MGAKSGNTVFFPLGVSGSSTARLYHWLSFLHLGESRCSAAKPHDLRSTIRSGLVVPINIPDIPFFAAFFPSGLLLRVRGMCFLLC